MKLKYDETDMHAQLVKVLYPDETAMFPVYCVYNDKSFMGNAMEYGYLAVTDKGRLLMIRYDFIGDGNCGSCPLTAICLLYTSPSPRDGATSRMPSSA